MKITTVSCQPTAGSVLLVGLMVTVIIGMLLLSYLGLVQNQHQRVARSQKWNEALAIAEAGVEEALAHLNPGVTEYTPPRDANGWVLVNGFYRPGGSGFRDLLGGRYAVVFEDAPYPAIYSTGYVRAPISGQVISRTVRVTTALGSLFGIGMAARTTIDLRGNYINIDSFNSQDPNKSTNGRYDPAKAQDNGDVATTSLVNSAFSIGNAKIKGKVRTGPGALPAIGPNGSVGDKAWVDNSNSGIKPGWWTDDMNHEFPDVLPPFTSGATPGSGSWNGTNYTYLLSSGNYMLSSITMRTGDRICVLPGQRAVLYVTGDFTMQGASFIHIAPDAQLKVYVGGREAVLTRVNTTGDASSFQYYGLPSNRSLTWSGNSEYAGTVYAPNAIFTLGGGGRNVMDYMGACVVNAIEMNGHFNFHFDENLRNRATGGFLTVSSWREI